MRGKKKKILANIDSLT